MNRKYWGVAIVFAAVALLVAACGGDSGDSGDTGETGEAGEAVEDAGAAEELYTANCAACHGGNLEGAMGPSLETAGADLSKDEIADVIKNGKGQMQPQTQLSDDEVEELAVWLAEKK